MYLLHFHRTTTKGTKEMGSLRNAIPTRLPWRGRTDLRLSMTASRSFVQVLRLFSSSFFYAFAPFSLDVRHAGYTAILYPPALFSGVQEV